MPRLSSRPFIAIAATLAVYGAAAAAMAQPTVIVAPNAPPAPRVEVVPSPTPQTQAMTWMAGHWSWNGASWVWLDGQYLAPPQAAARWTPGHWEQQATGSYLWVDGHWQG